MVDINELTLSQIKEVAGLFGNTNADYVVGTLETGSAQSSPFVLGKSYLFRTVTHTQTGRVVKKDGAFVQLEDAAWIADTGRFSKCLKEGTFSEVEPFTGNPWVNTASLVDAVEIDDLPLVVK